MADLICVQEPKKNLGLIKCDKLPQMIKGMIETPANWKLTPIQMATESAAKTAIQAAIKTGVANRVYLWPSFTGFENASTEAAYDETTISNLVADQGKYGFVFHVSRNMCLHKAMFSHNGQGSRFILVDKEDNLFLTELSDGSGAGFLAGLLNVEKLMIGDGSVATKTPIRLILKNHNEINKRGMMLPASYIDELIPLTDVDVTIKESPSVSTSGFDVEVKTSCDGTPVSGLVTADFAVTTTAGSAQANVVVAETPAGSGNYRFTKSSGTYEDGFVNLVAASALTIDAYESTGPATLNVP
jgi:hypothetical protein